MLSRMYGGRRAKQETTGHDRYWQERSGGPRRWRRRPATRAASATEADRPQPAGLQRRAVSSEDTRFVARLFSCFVQSPSADENQLRHGGRYEYMALEAEGCGERLEMERKAKAGAHSACTHYLATSTRYSLQHHLNDIGSRVDKHWFVVRDNSIKTERLLTLVPRAPGCPIKCDTATRETVLNLFLNLQHPYIYPVLDLEFTTDSQGETYIVTVIPYNNKGSLKDLIYKSVWQDDWYDKYSEKAEGLTVSQVRRLGRQILEALLFLKERGFPCWTHLHSGNIMVQNGVARLSGLENVLFGYTSRIHPTIAKSGTTDPSAMDVICFGHVLFEMCAGYELTEAIPNPSNLLHIADYPQVVELLEFIFNNPKRGYPSIEELLLCNFFRTIDLREMRAASLPQVYQARLTSSTMALLNDVKRHQRSQRCRRSQSSSTGESFSPSSPRNHSDSEEGKESEEDGDEDMTTGSHEESDSDFADSNLEHRNLSLHVKRNMSPVELTVDDSFMR